MGRYGAAILTVVGTIVGAYFGVPALGAVLGGLVGGFLFQANLPTVSGPRLSDVSTTSSNVGAPIPRGWGTWPTAGCVIWKSDLREVIEREEVGGKGGSSQTVETPTYYQDFAVGLNGSNIYGRGAIAGVRTIWANGKAIFDRRPKRDDETQTEFDTRMAASNQLEQTFTLYLGTETQLPDPTIEAVRGVGKTSAYRGLGYILFRNWKNKTEDGNRMPGQWKFECYTHGTPVFDETTEFSNEIMFEWLGGDDPLNPKNDHNIKLAYGGSAGVPNFTSVGPFVTVAEAVSTHEAYIGTTFDYYLGHGNGGWHPEGEGLGPETAGYTTRMGAPSARDTNAEEVFLIYNHFDAELQEPVVYGEANAVLAAGDRVGAVCGSEMIYHTNDSHAYPGAGSVIFRSTIPFPGPAPEGWDFNIVDFCGSPSSYLSFGTIDVAVVVSRLPRPPEDPCDQDGAAEIPGIDGYVIVDGALKRCGAWTYDDSQNYLVMQRYQAGGDATTMPLNPALPQTDPRNTEAFWTEQYELKVARGEMEPGLVYGVDYPDVQSFGYYRTLGGQVINTEDVSMRDIVEDLAEEGGYLTTDIDASNLEDVMIPGFTRARQMSVRAAYEPLRAVGFWDCAEIGGVIKFRRRGGAIDKTLTVEELRAHMEGGDLPSAVTTRMIQEMELPRSVRLHYLAPSRDYEAGEQRSTMRVQTAAQNDVDIEVAVVLDDDRAKQTAEIIHNDTWAGRWIHETQLSTENLALAPTDIVGLPVDDRIQRSRIVSITDALPSLRKLELNRDDDGSYVSTAVANVPPYKPTTPQLIAQGELLLLDIPALRTEDNDPGLYAVGRPKIIDGTFPGMGLYRSTDGGGNYVRIAQIPGAGVIGKVLTPAGNGTHLGFDHVNTLRVELYAGELENRTMEAVLAGANAAAVGVDGRWEIMQFTACVNEVGKIWEISELLRGRRGTEHFIGSGAIDDHFVLLSNTGTNVIRVPLPIASVNRPLLYKAPTATMSVDAADALSFTGRGVALKPFSPVFVAGDRAGNGVWTITFTRRDRFGIDLQGPFPLSEEFEDYEIDILDGSGNVVRTLSVSAPLASYSAAQQITDFDALQTSLSIVVYQISAQVGRGTGTEATL